MWSGGVVPRSGSTESIQWNILKKESISALQSRPDVTKWGVHEKINVPGSLKDSFILSLGKSERYF